MNIKFWFPLVQGTSSTSILQPPFFCYHTVFKHIWFSPNAGICDHLSARKEKLTWFPLCCAFSSRLLPVWSSHHYQWCCGPSWKQHPQEKGHSAPATQHPRLGQRPAEVTYLHQPFQGWHLTQAQHKPRDGSTAEVHVAQAEGWDNKGTIDSPGTVVWALSTEGSRTREGEMGQCILVPVNNFSFVL